MSHEARDDTKLLGIGPRSEKPRGLAWKSHKSRPGSELSCGPHQANGLKSKFSLSYESYDAKYARLGHDSHLREYGVCEVKAAAM